MKGLLVAGFIAVASSIKMKKGYINTTPTGSLHYYNPISSYTSPYTQVPYYTQTINQPIYSQQMGLSPTGAQVLPTTGLTQVIPTATGLNQMLQPSTLNYPINAVDTSYNPNFLSVQPTVVSTPPISNPLDQQYYYTTNGSQLYSPMGPTYYQSNDPSVLRSNSFYEYFQ